MTIVIVEHVMRAIMAVAKHIVVLDHGQKIAEGTPKEIVENPEVIRAYLGSYVHATGRSSVMLELSGVSASLRLGTGDHRCHHHVGEGEAVGLLGANGAGKSTTLRAISGLVKLTAGQRHLLPARTSRRCRRTGFRSSVSPTCRRDVRSFRK